MSGEFESFELGDVRAWGVGSESASVAPHTDLLSRAAKPPSEARDTLDSTAVKCGADEGDAGPATQARAWGRGEDEAEVSSPASEGVPVAGVAPARKRRNVLIQVPSATYDRLERFVERAGVPRAHFLSMALVIGAARLAAAADET